MPGIWEAMRDSRNPARCSPSRRCCCATSSSEGDRRAFAANLSIPTLDGRPGAPASRTPRTRARGSRRWPSSTARGSPRRPDRPAHARDQRRPGRSRRSSSCRRGRRGVGRRHRLHLRGEVRHVFMDWLSSTGPTWCHATSASTRAAPMRLSRSGRGWRGWCTRGGVLPRAAKPCSAARPRKPRRPRGRWPRRRRRSSRRCSRPSGSVSGRLQAGGSGGLRAIRGGTGCRGAPLCRAWRGCRLSGL